MEREMSFGVALTGDPVQINRCGDGEDPLHQAPGPWAGGGCAVGQDGQAAHAGREQRPGRT